MTHDDAFGVCPFCGVSWDAGEIPEKHRYLYSPPYRYSRVIAITLMGEDRVSSFQCPDCRTEFPRT